MILGNNERYYHSFVGLLVSNRRFENQLVIFQTVQKDFSMIYFQGGKSAIMTALVVGLGGKATTTNRGNSLKGFIKDKCR